MSLCVCPHFSSLHLFIYVHINVYILYLIHCYFYWYSSFPLATRLFHLAPGSLWKTLTAPLLFVMTRCPTSPSTFSGLTWNQIFLQEFLAFSSGPWCYETVDRNVEMSLLLELNHGSVFACVCVHALMCVCACTRVWVCTCISRALMLLILLYLRDSLLEARLLG